MITFFRDYFLLGPEKFGTRKSDHPFFCTAPPPFCKATTEYENFFQKLVYLFLRLLFIPQTLEKTGTFLKKKEGQHPKRSKNIASGFVGQ